MDAMVDIETLGTRLGSIILSIGAVAFDPKTGKMGEEFYCNIHTWSCVGAGLLCDMGTIDWWRKQSEEAKKRFYDPEPVDLGYGLTLFSNWFGKERLIGIWSHGLTFDIPMLTVAMERLGKRVPWNFKNARDTRTLFDLCPADFGREVVMDKGGTAHHALSDAKYQAKLVIAAMKALKGA